MLPFAFVTKAQELEKHRENEQALDGGASNLYIGACVGKKANGIYPVWYNLPFRIVGRSLKAKELVCSFY